MEKGVQESHRNFLNQELSTAKTEPMIIICLTRSKLLIGIDAIWLISLLCVDEDHSKLIAKYSCYTTTELSIILNSCLTAIKTMSLNISKLAIRGTVKIYFSILNSREIHHKLTS